MNTEAPQEEEAPVSDQHYNQNWFVPPPRILDQPSWWQSLSPKLYKSKSIKAKLLQGGSTDLLLLDQLGVLGRKTCY